MTIKDNPGELRECLPEKLKMLYDGTDGLEEIRIRRNNRAVLCRDGKNHLTDIFVSGGEFNEMIEKLCRGSLYAYEEQIAEGYIPFDNGCRIGICGRSVAGRITSARDIDSVNIRISRFIPGVSGALFSYMRSHGFRKSILIYSPPAVGKTTLLRDIAVRLSSPPALIKTVLADSRNEIYVPEMDGCPALYVYKGLAKSKAIEYSIRTMSPQMIICDELGSREDVVAVIVNRSCGVPLIATAHASGYGELISREGFDEMHRLGIFDTYVLLKRSGNRFEFDIKERQ